ncbi:MAG TPA: CHAT domain-containing protein, partial [Roseiflexaceae bacterium]|nr:CHAT domain-containing protein [Roseiflexaceae bacterium]
RASAASLDAALRLRLFIGSNAPELHNLRWETLRDPQNGEALFSGEQFLFSRYLSSGDWRPIAPRPKGELRALVAIANPADLPKYHLAPLDVQAELQRATAGLGTIPATALFGGGANLNNIVAQLREGYDILYLVAHGTLAKGEPWLWLEDEHGAIRRVAASELVGQIKGLRERPRLVMLVSCQSAGTGDSVRAANEGALAGLGPRLAEAGIPAVVAMQGNLSLETAEQFMPVFFKELQRDGQIDRAMAVARGAVRERDDSWMPVLFMRLKTGKIWYVPGFGDGQTFEKWPTMLRAIRNGKCTVIVGSDFAEPLLGSSREIAQSWAETYHFPMRSNDREDLPQVAQYLSVHQSPNFPREELAEYLEAQLHERYDTMLPAKMADAPLGDLFAYLGAQRRAANPADPYKVLAQLPFPIYITTNTTNLLYEALLAEGKDPQIELCRWNEDLEMIGSIFEEEPDYTPTAERPLVFHMFGITDEPSSVVLT